MSHTLKSLADKLGAELVLKPGLDEQEITGLASLSTATNTQVSFLSNPKYTNQLSETNAAAVIVKQDQVVDCPVHAIVMDDPYLGFGMLAQVFDATPQVPEGIHLSAVIDDSAFVDSTARIGPNVVIGKDASVGANVQLHANVVIGEGVKIDDDCVIYPNVTFYHGVQVGKRCIFHSGAVVGSDGFGLVNHQGRWQKIPQLGSVRIEDDVEIGATTTIDRGALEDTVIETGAKLDNQMQIAHNVTIGAHTAMAGQSVVAGSTKIGKHCMIGGASAINGHLEIADQVMLTGMSGVSKSINEPGVYSSSINARDRKTWFRALANLYRLDKLHNKFKQLDARIKQLEKE